MTNPHLSEEPLHIGADLGLGRVVVVAVHGRGQSPAYMLEHVVGMGVFTLLRLVA